MTTGRRTGSYGVLAAVAVLGAALGCTEDAPTESLSTEQFAQAREAATQRAARPVAPPPAVAPAPPEATIDPISGVAQIDTGYTYDPTGKRDPFRSFIWDRQDKLAAEIADAGPLGQFDLSQLEVVAVVWATGNARALVEDPSGESYIVGEGAAIGKNRGHVISIGDNTVVVKETYVDYLGQETTKDVEMRIRRSEGG